MKNKLIYIGGWGRSGSTIISSVLTKSIDSIFIGEMRYYWDRLILEDSLCGCGKVGSKCEFWLEVTKSLSIKEENFDDFIAQNLCIVGSRARPKQALNFLPFFKDMYFKRYAKEIGNLSSLYDTIANVSKKDVVVDSSKSPFYFSVVSQMKNFEVYFIHVVRDPRAVCASWQKTKETKDFENSKSMFPRYSIIRSSLQWLVVNTLCLFFRYIRNVNYKQVSYEQFARNPKDTINEIIKFADLNHSDSPKSMIHSISGNPVRFEDLSQLKIKEDNSWKTNLSLFNQIIIKLLTIPFSTINRKK